MRESTQSWREVLLNLKARGLTAPALGDWRWGHGVLGSLGGNLPEHTTATLLVPQDEQCLECAPDESAAQGETGVTRDLAGGHQSRRCPSLRRLSGRPMSRSIPRRRGVCRKIGRRCSRSSSFRLITGRVCAPRIRLNPRLGPFDIGRHGPRGVSLAMAYCT